MPHDINNTEILPGDHVLVECVVESVYQTDDGKYCNLNVKTTLPMPPYETGTSVTLNTRQVVLLSRAGK